jgi:hypothetical protein
MTVTTLNLQNLARYDDAYVGTKLSAHVVAGSGAMAAGFAIGNPFLLLLSLPIMALMYYSRNHIPIVNYIIKEMLPELRNLRTLKLIHCNIQKDMVDNIITALRQLPNLRELDLTRNSIGDAGEAAIRAAIPAGCRVLFH